MTICDFCFNEVFQSDEVVGSYKPHHLGSSSWKQSFESGCDICTVLLQRLRDFQAQATRDAARLQLCEENLLDLHHQKETLEGPYSEGTCILRSPLAVLDQDLHWPIYQFIVQDSGKEGQFCLMFNPSADSLDEIDDRNSSGLLQQGFEIYSIENKSGGSAAPKLHNRTDCELTFAQVQTWVEDCGIGNHVNCNPIVTKEGTGLGGSKSKFVPTRLLRVDGRSGLTVRLIKTETEKFQGHYTTLRYPSILPKPDAMLIIESHCWGSSHFITLRSHNYEEMLKDIPFTEFPLSFQQAMQVTLRLGLQHIWIDSLCIIQGDADDWIREGLRMDEIYRNSYCNIAAVNARGASEGLFRDRKPTRLAPSIISASWEGTNQRYKVVQDRFWENELLAEPLYRRAWVFQERMLAPRILHFGGRQVFWQCNSLAACETLPEGLPDVISYIPHGERRWRELVLTISSDNLTEYDKADIRRIRRIAVESYTSCNLTKKTDKLIAFAGIAKQFSRALNEKYVAGLWTNDLVTQLGWYVKDSATADGQPSIRQESGNFQMPPRLWYRAPSWAWPSVDGVIGLPVQVRQSHNHYRLALLEEPHVEFRQAGDEFGQISQGSLHVQGLLYSLEFKALSPEHNEFSWRFLPDDQRGYPREDDSVWMRLYPDDRTSLVLRDDGDGFHTLECQILMLSYTSTNSDPLNSGAVSYSGQGLALRKTSRRNIFARIGCVKFRQLTAIQWKMIESAKICSASHAGTEAYEIACGHTLTLV
ncbi:MAG: hypothetical protein M1822_000291 [Bathelium mastoideum]|nr:MAG: hypothetical protein M1822_000291 [Bathelium mastoideum]